MRSSVDKAPWLGHSCGIGFAGMALSALALSGCDGGGGPVGSTPTRSPTWTQGCGAPELLFSPRALNEDTFSTGLIASIAADAEVLFFATDEAVYRVPAAGGEPEQLIADANGYSTGRIWQAGGRFLVSRLYAGSKASVLELPLTGTAVTMVIDSIPYLPGESTFGSRKIFWIDEAHVYWQASRPFSRDGKDYAAYPLHRMPWQGKGPVENLVELTAGLSTAWKQGDMLWILDYPGYYDSLANPRLLSLPAAGGTTAFKMNFARGEWLISGDDNSLYFDLLYRNGAYHPGLGRLYSQSGRQMDYPYSGNVGEIWPESDRLVVVDFDYINSNPVRTLQDLGERLWTVPIAGGVATPIGCIDNGTAHVEARAKAGKNVYMSLHMSGSKLNTIAKLTLP